MISPIPTRQGGEGNKCYVGGGEGKGVEGGKGVTRTIKTMVIRAVGRSKKSRGAEVMW